MQRCGAAGQRGHVFGFEPAGQRGLELGQPRAERQHPRAQRLEQQLLLAGAHERARQRDGVRPGGAQPSATPAPARSRSTAAREHAGLERVHQRLPAGLDDVLRHPDRAPCVVPVAGVEQHARDRAGALVLVEDPDLEVHQLDVAEVGVGLADGLPQRLVERVHGAVALRGAHEPLAVDPDLDGGLGLDPVLLALLDDHAPGLEPEQRLVVAGLPPDEQVERAVCGLQVITAMLEVLYALHHPRGPLLGETHARVLGPGLHVSLCRRARRSAAGGRLPLRPGPRARRSGRRDSRPPRACRPCGRRRWPPRRAGWGWGPRCTARPPGERSR